MSGSAEHARISWKAVAVAAAVALSLGLAGFGGARSEGMGPAGPARGQDPAGGFRLVDQDGRPFELARERGKVVLLYFGWTLTVYFLEPGLR